MREKALEPPRMYLVIPKLCMRIYAKFDTRLMPFAYGNGAVMGLSISLRIQSRKKKSNLTLSALLRPRNFLIKT
jgi:hypothetical protein